MSIKESWCKLILRTSYLQRQHKHNELCRCNFNYSWVHVTILLSETFQGLVKISPLVWQILQSRTCNKYESDNCLKCAFGQGVCRTKVLAMMCIRVWHTCWWLYPGSHWNQIQSDKQPLSMMRYAPGLMFAFHFFFILELKMASCLWKVRGTSQHVTLFQQKNWLDCCRLLLLSSHASDRF